MEVVVIGLGSMGKRRIRLLRERKDIAIFGIDSNAERCAEVREKFGVECFPGLDEACAARRIDCALVCTSPLSHAAIISDCLDHGLHVFTEINLVSDGYAENIAKAKEKGKVLFLSSTFLYQDDTDKIIEKVKGSQAPLNYIYHVGQYLPDWHPWESYNSYFIGNPRTNGCREILAIELPWIVTCFGAVKSVKCIKSKNTGLNVSYDDNLMILLEHEGGAKGCFAVDVVSRCAIRNLEIFGEDLHLFWHGSVETLSEYDIASKQVKPVKIDSVSEHMEGYADFIDENPYRKEIASFLDLVEGRADTSVWDFERDTQVLKLIDEIES